MLTHANLLAVVAGQRAAIDQIGGAYGQRFTPEDTMISYLPLAHIFDRCACARARALMARRAPAASRVACCMR